MGQIEGRVSTALLLMELSPPHPPALEVAATERDAQQALPACGTVTRPVQSECVGLAPSSLETWVPLPSSFTLSHRERRALFWPGPGCEVLLGERSLMIVMLTRTREPYLQ